MVAMIILGVLIFRKCKQSSPEPTLDWEDPNLQKNYKPKNPQASTGNMSQSKRNVKMMPK